MTTPIGRQILAAIESWRTVAEAPGIAGTRVKPVSTGPYHKTGTNRQANLVKLAAAFSNPLLKSPSYPRPGVPYPPKRRTRRLTKTVTWSRHKWWGLASRRASCVDCPSPSRPSSVCL
jgi:hypothetical protein